MGHAQTSVIENAAEGGAKQRVRRVMPEEQAESRYHTLLPSAYNNLVASNIVINLDELKQPEAGKSLILTSARKFSLPFVCPSVCPCVCLSVFKITKINYWTDLLEILSV